jgi:hypothetical protein
MPWHAAATSNPGTEGGCQWPISASHEWGAVSIKSDSLCRSCGGHTTCPVDAYVIDYACRLMLVMMRAFRTKSSSLSRSLSIATLQVDSFRSGGSFPDKNAGVGGKPGSHPPHRHRGPRRMQCTEGPGPKAHSTSAPEFRRPYVKAQAGPILKGESSQPALSLAS